jgi:hypothetical protein
MVSTSIGLDIRNKKVALCSIKHHLGVAFFLSDIVPRVRDLNPGNALVIIKIFIALSCHLFFRGEGLRVLLRTLGVKRCSSPA